MSRVRSSLLLKLMAALVVAVVGSGVATTVVEGGLARTALRDQSRRVTASNLRVLTQAYGERERNLVLGLRNLGQALAGGSLLGPESRTDLIARLGSVHRNLELDILQVAGPPGSAFDPPVGVGESLSRPAVLVPGDRRVPASRLLTTRDGRWLQAVVVSIGAGADGPALVGGYEFTDAFAYRLRRQLGDAGHVVLVADGAVVGTTLVETQRTPPGLAENGGALPATAVVARLDGVENLVAYHPIGGGGGVVGALGVTLADPEAPLRRALTSARLQAGLGLALLTLVGGWLYLRLLVRPLARLTATAGRIAGGDLEASFAAPGRDEVAALAAALERMRNELRHQLEVIASQGSALQDSSQRIVAAQDEERHRLARDLHDGIQQHLVVLRMGFGLASEAAQRAPHDVPRSLETLSAELDAVIERLREVSHDLYPSILVDRGLAAALRSLLSRVPLPASLVCRPDPLPRMPPEIESGAYFFVSEALTNALKHAAASEVSVRLEVDGRWLAVDVSDDGRGFSAVPGARAGGLLHMDDRARSFGGQFTIDSRPGAGTRVAATFPLPSRVGADGPG